VLYTKYDDYWYVLFVLTGHEQEAARDIREAFSREEILPFLPNVERLFKKKSETKKELHLMFPGYVFIETKLSGDDFRTRSIETIKRSKHITRLLCGSDCESMAVSDAERSVLSAFWKDERKIEASRGLVEGDNIRIIEGSLMGFESAIKKIDRHRREAIVEIELFGKMQPVRVALEIVRKI